MTSPYCTRCDLRIELCPYAGEHPTDPTVVASDQIISALSNLDRPAAAYVRWPWPVLDELYGGMRPGSVHYVVGFSGLGKTTFIASAIRRWQERGRTVDVMPLENDAGTFRTYVACQELGIDPGLMLSGDFWKLPNAQALRDTVKAAVRAQMQTPIVKRMHVHSTDRIDLVRFRAAVEWATEHGADILVVDHVDHIGGDKAQKQSLYQASVEVNNAALDLAKQTGLVMILMSQANQDALRNNTDHLAKYQPLREQHVLMGGHKRQNATGMIGLFRPLAAPMDGETSDDYKARIKAARQGQAEPQTALEPGVVGVNVMKSRNYGGREGKSVRLRWVNGRIEDPESYPRLMRDRGAA